MRSHSQVFVCVTNVLELMDRPLIGSGEAYGISTNEMSAG
jgi:hypothetical protein